MLMLSKFQAWLILQIIHGHKNFSILLLYFWYSIKRMSNKIICHFKISNPFEPSKYKKKTTKFKPKKFPKINDYEKLTKKVSHNHLFWEIFFIHIWSFFCIFRVRTVSNSRNFELYFCLNVEMNLSLYE